MRPKAFAKNGTGYFVAVVGIAAVTAVLKLFSAHINPTTVALGLLLVVLFVATGWGARPAVGASLLGVLCFNFFFLPPFGTLMVAAPDNWIALIAFLITAITVGQLSARAKRRREEAEAGSREIERLYGELKEAFESASQAEALKQSERLKSALLDAVTHDIRTPLTAIKASVTTLLDETRGKAYNGESVKLDPDLREDMLVVIDEESDRLNRFVEGLIELARIEAGEMLLRRRWGAVDEIIAMALARAEPLTRSHRVIVKLEDQLPVVRVDPRAVAEVVYTLVDNATKYSPAGTTIKVEARRAGDDMIQLAVEDQGEGIRDELRERVFDKFFRATRDGDLSTGRPMGTGMGLAIAKGIVEAHGGFIRIEDGQDSRGSRLIFRIPIGDDDDDDRDGGRVDLSHEVTGIEAVQDQ